MDYFWILPFAIIFALGVWALYAAITRDAGERVDGAILTDKPSSQK